jgi:multidrug efflux pump subunit AcrB
MPPLLREFPGLRYSLEGERREQMESMQSLLLGTVAALLAIYALLAVPFRSYLQPLVVMSVIPFGLIGAVLGHVVLGYDLSIISIFGLIALSGIVVNDSLVLIVTANRLREEGLSAREALVQAGVRRFRAIMLTSLTTFFGLMPIIFETSNQARFLIPMAISLGFGVLFVTFLVLLLTPAIYMMLEDILALARRLRGAPGGQRAGAARPRTSP